MFDIAARLKSVDRNYRLYFNKLSNRYEVHNILQRPSTLAFVVPYGELDARTVEYARFSRVQNAEKVFRDIEENNERLAKEAQERNINTLLKGLEEL